MGVVDDDELREALRELESATTLLRELRRGGASAPLDAPFARSRAAIEEAADLLLAARVRVEQALARWGPPE